MKKDFHLSISRECHGTHLATIMCFFKGINTFIGHAIPQFNRTISTSGNKVPGTWFISKILTLN